MGSTGLSWIEALRRTPRQGHRSAQLPPGLFAGQQNQQGAQSQSTGKSGGLNLSPLTAATHMPAQPTNLADINPTNPFWDWNASNPGNSWDPGYGGGGDSSYVSPGYNGGSWPNIPAPSWAKAIQQGAGNLAANQQQNQYQQQAGQNQQPGAAIWGGQNQQWGPQAPNIPFDINNLNPTFQGMHNYQMGWMPPQLYGGLLNQSMSPYGQGPYNDPRYMPWSSGMLSGIGGYMDGTNPVMQQLAGMFPQTGDILSLTGAGYSHLLNTGLPGQATLLDPSAFAQDQQMAQGMLGNVNLGLQDWYSRGMPGRQEMMNLFNPQQTGGLARTVLDSLLQSGAPGRELIEGRMGGWGQQGDQAQNLVGGMYQNWAMQGLPGQVTMQDLLLPGQQGTFQVLQGANIGNVNDLISQARSGGPDIQNQAGSALSSMISGGGLTPEYIQAMRNQVFEPGMENLMGRINQQLGGEGSLSSGLSAELQRRGERDFQDQLIRAGMGNLSTAIGQGMGLGGQQYGQLANAIGMQGDLAQQSFGNQFDMFNALANQGMNLAGQYGNFGQQGTENLFRGYQSIPGTELPILQMGLGQGQQDISNMFGARGSLMDEGFGVTDRGMQFGNLLNQTNFDRFGLNQLPMGLLQQAANFGYSPFDRYGQFQQQGLNQGLNAWNQMGGDQAQQYQQALQLANLLQGGGIQMSDIMSSILRTGMTGEYQEGAANKGLWGNIISSAMQLVPWFF